MPRTKLTEKYCKPRVPEPNYLSELLKRYKKANSLSDEALAEKLDISRITVNRRMNQKPDEWNIGELRTFCTALDVPFADALNAAQGKKETDHGGGP